MGYCSRDGAVSTRRWVCAGLYSAAHWAWLLSWSEGAGGSFESAASLTGLHLLMCEGQRLQKWESCCQGWVSLLLFFLWWLRIGWRLLGRSPAWTTLSFHRRSHLWLCYPSLASPGGFQMFLRALLLTHVSWPNYESAHCYFLNVFKIHYFNTLLCQWSWMISDPNAFRS